MATSHCFSCSKLVKICESWTYAPPKRAQVSSTAMLHKGSICKEWTVNLREVQERLKKKAKDFVNTDGCPWHPCYFFTSALRTPSSFQDLLIFFRVSMFACLHILSEGNEPKQRLTPSAICHVQHLRLGPKYERQRLDLWQTCCTFCTQSPKTDLKPA